MIQFPITDLLDQDECYRFLLETLHPEGLQCPNGHPLREGQAPHDRKRAPLVKYRCRSCGAVFNIFTGTSTSYGVFIDEISVSDSGTLGALALTSAPAGSTTVDFVATAAIFLLLVVGLPIVVVGIEFGELIHAKLPVLEKGHGGPTAHIKEIVPEGVIPEGGY